MSSTLLLDITLRRRYDNLMPYADPGEKREYHRRYMRERYSQNPQEQIRLTAQTQHRMRLRIEAYKVACGCIYCGEKHPACLDFHHRDPTKKEITVSSAVKKGWSWDRTIQEIRKCDVVCSNCHRKIHWHQINSVAVMGSDPTTATV